MRDRCSLTPEIERLDAAQREYGNLLKPARDKIIAHRDLEIHVDDVALGVHGREVLAEFFENMQVYFDAAGNAVGVGPLDFRNPPGPGDITDLVRTLKRANAAARE